MNKTPFLLAATFAAAAAGLAPALAQTAAGGAAGVTVVAPDALTPEQFVATAVASNTFEIETSQAALEAAQLVEVRDFAERMIADHTAAAARLEAAAEAAGTSAPPAYLDERRREMLATLQGATAETFDEAYLEMQLEAHDEAVALFSAYAGREDALGAFAAETLPALEAHRAAARELIGRP